jgi:hypothetical protein
MGKASITALRNLPEFQRTSRDDRSTWNWSADASDGANHNWELGGKLSDLDLFAKRARVLLPLDGLEIEFLEVTDYTVLKMLQGLIGEPFFLKLDNLDDVQGQPPAVEGVFTLNLADVKPRVFTNYYFGWVATFIAEGKIRVSGLYE